MPPHAFGDASGVLYWVVFSGWLSSACVPVTLIIYNILSQSAIHTVTGFARQISATNAGRTGLPGIGDCALTNELPEVVLAVAAYAMLNYLYAILRAEIRLGTATLGMEPGLSVFHSTKRWRDSSSYDLMEPIRPLVDRWLLEFLEGREFSRRDFFETRRGIVRVLPPISAELSETAPTWAEVSGPLIENAAQELMAWADGGKRGALTRRNGHTFDGAILPTNLTSEYRKKGQPKETRKRARSAREGWAANQEWERENSNTTINIDYEEEILPPLRFLKLREIVDATGLSMSYAAAIRNGREVPHRRHWRPLLQLVERESGRVKAKRKLSQRWAETDFERDIQPGLRDLPIADIADAIGVPKPYAARIRRGARIPARKHWKKLEQLSEGDRCL